MQTGQTVRWGILSTAHINRRLIPTIQASERGTLVAVASRSQQRAEAYAARWEIPRAFGDYQAMLDFDGIDAVYVSLPHHLHAEWTVRALRSGKHVLCEKPFALTLKDVGAMVDAAEETGLALAEAFHYLHHPQTKIAGEWIHTGRLGQVTLMRGTFNFVLTKPDDFRWDPRLGGGSMWDVAVYPISLAQFIFGGPPVRVTAEQVLGETSVDVVFAAQMRYPGGELAQIASSFCTPFYASAEVFGTAGRLTFNCPFGGLDNPDCRLLFHPPEGPPEEIPVPVKNLYLGEVEDMHRAILDGVPNHLTLEETRDHVGTGLALLEAARTGQPVWLERA